MYHYPDITRFLDSPFCDIWLSGEDPNLRDRRSVPSYILTTYQCETIDQASQLRHTLASAASAATSVNGHAAAAPPVPTISPELIENSMERRLSSWINAIEEQLVPFQPSPSSFDGVSVSRASLSSSDPEIAVVGRSNLRQRRGGIDLGDSYWDLEKSRALQEAKTELDSLHLKRLFSGFEL